jgi:hypothetical protein
MLLYVVARERWRWSALTAGSLAAVFLIVDLAFFGANIIKVAQGGWLPLILAGLIYLVMTTWKGGPSDSGGAYPGRGAPARQLPQGSARTGRDTMVAPPADHVFGRGGLAESCRDLHADS